METRLFGDLNAANNGGHATSKDLWLKAATIAVPIAGGFILVLLVLLAIRMLRRDRENNNDYMPTSSHNDDFQIRCVWGKTRQLHQQQHGHNHAQQQQQQQQRGWKDMQPMLSSRSAMDAPLAGKFAALKSCQQQQHDNQIVYLPSVHKTITQKMWNKRSHGIFPIVKNSANVYHV